MSNQEITITHKDNGENTTPERAESRSKEDRSGTAAKKGYTILATNGEQQPIDSRRHRQEKESLEYLSW